MKPVKFCFVCGEVYGSEDFKSCCECGSKLANVKHFIGTIEENYGFPMLKFVGEPNGT